MCVRGMCVCVYIRVFVRVWAFVKGDYTLMFEDDQNVIHVKVMRHYTVCLLRTYRVVFQGDVSIQARLLAHTHTHTHTHTPHLPFFSNTCTQTRKDTRSRATKQGHEQRKKSPGKRAEGSRKERAKWIKNEVKEEIADEERRRGNHFFSKRVRGAEY